MKAFTKFLTAAAAAATMMVGAGAANAATTFDEVNLTGVGTDFFGAVIKEAPGVFTHTFNFTLTEDGKANSSLTTIKLGANDVDISSITLNGFNFVQTGFDPKAELWELTSALLGAGAHTITVKGSFAGSQQEGGSYSGVLNIAAVPEPASWALMIMGFGGAGAMIRRRRVNAAAFA